MDLDGPQRKVLRLALLSAFDRNSLDTLLQDNDRPGLEQLVKSSSFGREVFDLIALAERQGWLGDLISFAQRESANPKIKHLQADFAVVHVEPADQPRLVEGSLERTVNKLAGMENFDDWLEKMTVCRGWVCRIEDPRDPRKALGTGFLVGPDLVMTNYHVVADYISKRLDTSQLGCRFDFTKDGAELDGRTVPVATDGWIISFAPFSRFDPGDRGGFPSTDEADYAVMRLAVQVGEEGNRGWAKLSQMVPQPTASDPLIIVQHPEGSPLKLAIGTVQRLNENMTRLRYTTNTEGGSSGSPCFNFRLELVAIHHGGDPDRSRSAEFNQGVPVERIIEHLTKQPNVVPFWQ